MLLLSIVVATVVGFRPTVKINPNPITRVIEPLPYADIALKAPASLEYDHNLKEVNK